MADEPSVKASALQRMAPTVHDLASSICPVSLLLRAYNYSVCVYVGSWNLCTYQVIFACRFHNKLFRTVFDVEM